MGGKYRRGGRAKGRQKFIRKIYSLGACGGLERRRKRCFAAVGRRWALGAPHLTAGRRWGAGGRRWAAKSRYGGPPPAQHTG